MKEVTCKQCTMKDECVSREDCLVESSKENAKKRTIELNSRRRGKEIVFDFLLNKE